MLLLGLGAIFAAFLLPGHYPPWLSFEQQTMAALGASIICATLLIQHGARKVSLPPLAICLIACAGFPLLQRATGQIRFTGDAVLAAAYLLAFATSVVVSATGTKTQRRTLTDGLGLALIAAGIASIGLAAAQWLGQGFGIWLVDLPPGGRPYANLAQPNHLATLLGLSTMAVLKRFEQRQLDGRVTALAITWLGFGIAMTQSRTGWLFVALLVMWWAAMRRRAGLRLPAVAVASGMATFAALAAGWETLSHALLLSSGTLEERLHAGTRWIHWQTLWDAIGRAPWFGYGWQQVGLAQQAEALDHPATGEWLQNSHNLFLDLLIWNGVPLGLLFFAVLVTWFVMQIRVCRSAERWAVLGSVGAVFMHALLEYPLDYTYFLLPVGLMMGALERGVGDGPQIRIPRAVIAVALAAQLVLLGFITAEYLQVQESTRQLRFMLMRIVVPGGAVPPPPAVRLLDAPREFHRFWLVEAHRGMSAEEVEWMQRVSQRYPVPAALLRYALAAGLNGRPDEAATALGNLCKMHAPARCDEGRVAWAELQGRYPELRAIVAPPMPLPAPPVDKVRTNE